MFIERREHIQTGSWDRRTPGVLLCKRSGAGGPRPTEERSQRTGEPSGSSPDPQSPRRDGHRHTTGPQPGQDPEQPDKMRVPQQGFPTPCQRRFRSRWFPIDATFPDILFA